MKKISLLLVIAVMCFTSCDKYLDIVPDQITKMEDLFTTKTDALDALAKIYSYLPAIDNINESPFLLGDEYVVNKAGIVDDASSLYAQRIMRDMQSLGTPLLGLWSGTGGGKHYYVGIRHCDLVLQYVDLVFDMSTSEKEEMKAQVKFLKAYYAFLLIQQYGPIVIPQFLETDETDPEKLFPYRASIDSSFNYVISLMREAIPLLRSKAPIADYGQVDQTVAKSILARVLVFRASPFFNGNSDLFGSFRNLDGTHFFPMEYKKEKWKDALDALDDAIQTCENAGIKLFEYSRPTYYAYDTAFEKYSPGNIQKYYTRRFVLTEPWNSGLIWARSAIYHSSYDNNVLSNACNIILPKDTEYEGEGLTEQELEAGSGQFLSASYQMLERYYTENGLPIDQDRTYAVDNKYRITTVPENDNPVYLTKYIGLLQPEHKVIQLYLNREIRFYADLVITGGYSRSHRYRVSTSMFQDTYGGRNPAKNPDSYFCTGIGIQKMVHPESASGLSYMQVAFPFPYIRLADLYLMRAEARNEYNEGPDQQVWDDVNKIRRQAGIRDVDDVWADPQYAISLNKHKEYLGMRDIILQERAIELAFEGIHYWDMVRYNRAINEFSKPITGWNINGETAEDFFLLRSIQFRRFSRASYLWPIPLGEMNINSNLVNNPGWE